MFTTVRWAAGMDTDTIDRYALTGVGTTMAMTSTAEKVRQLAPHWGVMFAAMFVTLALIESFVGPLAFWQSLLIVFVIAFGYPAVVRALGLAPEVWQR